MKSQDKFGLHSLALKLLKQLVRILIKHEISHSEFNELSKQAYAETAFKHFQLENRKMTYARVAVLTGLNRKEVVRLLDAKKQYPHKPKVTPNKVKRVVMGWISDPEFCDAKGEPKPLSFKEPGSQFHRLISKYGADISIGAVLDELKFLNLVHEREEQIDLINKEFLPGQDNIDDVRIVTESATNLIKTGIENMQAKSVFDKKFQRQLKLNFNDEAILNEFKAFSNQKSQELLLEFFAWKQAQQATGEKDQEEKDISETEKVNKKVGIGIYYFEEE